MRKKAIIVLILNLILHEIIKKREKWFGIVKFKYIFSNLNFIEKKAKFLKIYVYFNCFFVRLRNSSF